MPTTRALSARQQSGAAGATAGSDDIDNIKAMHAKTASGLSLTENGEASQRATLSLTRVPRLFRRTSSASSTSSYSPAPRTFQRTCSSPITLQSPSALEGFDYISSRSRASAPRSSYGGSSTSSQTSSKASTRPTNGFRRVKSSASLCSNSQSNSQASGGEEDDSDEERRYNRRSSRLGGCGRSSETRTSRDDTNKENIAPFRRVEQLTPRQRMNEDRDAQEEAVARRTRSTAATPMRGRHSSPASSIHSGSSEARSSYSLSQSRLHADLGNADTPRRPTTTRKRSRMARDDEGEQGEADVRSPRSSLARLRLQRTPSCASASSLAEVNDEAESYFSSQNTNVSSVFDVGMASTPDGAASDDDEDDVESQPTSRAPSPVSDFACVPMDAESTLDEASLIHDGGAVHDEANAQEHHFSNVYAHARALLRCNAGTDAVDEGVNAAVDQQVIGRDKERKALQRFLHSRFDLYRHMEHSATPAGEGDHGCELDGAQDSGALYVCGMPGTGKTALLRSTLAQLREADLATTSPSIAFVNCMTVEHPRDIFAKVLEAMGVSFDRQNAEKTLDAIARDSRQRTLIVLDEIDHLLGSRTHQNILYRLFSWATGSAPGKDGTGTCALIGIANSLDLTERFVPLLASKGAEPALLHFRPFEAAEIGSVIRARLAALLPRYDQHTSDDDVDAGDVEEPAPLALFAPAALDLASKKIAAATGDLRKALDAARLAIELVEAEQRKKHAASEADGWKSEVNGKILAHLTPKSAPKVSPQHIVKVLASVLGSQQLNKIRALSLQPKLALAAILVCQKRQAEGLAVLGSGNSEAKKFTKPCATSQLADVELTYSAVLRNDGNILPTLESSEFLDVLDLLSVHGFIVMEEATGSGYNSGTLSAGARRATKKQHIAATRIVRLAISFEDALRGLTTEGSVSGNATSTAAARRLWSAEEERIRRSRGWEARAKEIEATRAEELGGGRMAQGCF
ncbi:P-loop containing nucleoside triphosphate hydrolase protein [Ceraceosorus guamensis]|uniref:P-loop containing nucleoside triphosphate hydrolase protein n=1 Tax=Ceraceosorus guamensis TaxID=1522189 RepID=A0A316W256_9BASI|nr:P-loop containing nucleoside triphosphate hydrolase protein [Ceraceosorus guamensis]PWN43759.1 P-loop containing nucleoside triphosphate hydrolase protein [Ceraceosorus guamensis]